MANFVIPDDPVFNVDEVRELETTDPAHASLFNGLFQTLLDNDAYLLSHGGGGGSYSYDEGTQTLTFQMAKDQMAKEE